MHKTLQPGWAPASISLVVPGAVSSRTVRWQPVWVGPAARWPAVLGSWPGRSLSPGLGRWQSCVWRVMHTRGWLRGWAGGGL